MSSCFWDQAMRVALGIVLLTARRYDEIVISLSREVAFRDLQHVKSKFCLQVRGRIVFIHHHMSIFPSQFWVEKRLSGIRGEAVNLYVRDVVRHRPERKCELVQVL